MAAMASTRLFQDFPSEVGRFPDLDSESDPVIRWYKALRFIGGRYEEGHSAQQTNDDGSSGGWIFMGSIQQPAAASATLCVELAARPKERGALSKGETPEVLKEAGADTTPLRASDLIGAWTAIYEFIMPHCRPNDPDHEALTRAQDAFITAAFDEEINVWGRLEVSGEITKIDKWFWRNAQIDPIESMRDGDKAVFLTDAPLFSDRQTSISKYVECEVDKRQIERKWPLASSNAGLENC